MRRSEIQPLHLLLKWLGHYCHTHTCNMHTLSLYTHTCFTSHMHTYITITHTHTPTHTAEADALSRLRRGHFRQQGVGALATEAKEREIC